MSESLSGHGCDLSNVGLFGLNFNGVPLDVSDSGVVGNDYAQNRLYWDDADRASPDIHVRPSRKVLSPDEVCDMAPARSSSEGFKRESPWAFRIRMCIVAAVLAVIGGLAQAKVENVPKTRSYSAEDVVPLDNKQMDKILAGSAQRQDFNL